MPNIVMLEGWDAYPKRSTTKKGGNTMARRKRSGGKRSAQAKFKRVAKICGKKKGKAARKSCWRSHYR